MTIDSKMMTAAAKAAYRGYRESLTRHGGAVRGAVPTFEALPEAEQRAWEAAVVAVLLFPARTVGGGQ